MSDDALILPHRANPARMEFSGTTAAHIAFLIGVRNRITVLASWLWAYLTFRRGSRLITGSGTFDTR